MGSCIGIARAPRRLACLDVPFLRSCSMQIECVTHRPTLCLTDTAAGTSERAACMLHPPYSSDAEPRQARHNQKKNSNKPAHAAGAKLQLVPVALCISHHGSFLVAFRSPSHPTDHLRLQLRGICLLSGSDSRFLFGAVTATLVGSEIVLRLSK